MRKFFLKISKSRLKQFSQVQLKTRPRAMQVYLALLSWLNKQNSLSLGVEYYYGRASGQLCYYKNLKRFIHNWTGLEHKQIVRYLREFEDKGLIYRDDKQVSLDGKVRPQLFLSPAGDLRAKPGEKYLLLNMRECGKRGFDIYGHLEQCMQVDSHPAHPDQLTFTISRQTRSYRKQSKTYKPKPERRPRKCKKQSFARIAKKDRLVNIKGRKGRLVDRKSASGGDKKIESGQNMIKSRECPQNTFCGKTEKFQSISPLYPSLNIKNIDSGPIEKSGRFTEKIAKRPVKSRLVSSSLENTSQPAGLSALCKNMTPIDNHNPFPFYRMENKTTHSAKKSAKIYQKQLCLIYKTKRKWVDWWKTKRADSEYIKVQAGLALSDQVLWYNGKLYRQKCPKSDPYVYEFVPKRARRWQDVPDYGPHVPSVEQTRQKIADSLGLSLPEYLNRLKRENERRVL